MKKVNNNISDNINNDINYVPEKSYITKNIIVFSNNEEDQNNFIYGSDENNKDNYQMIYGYDYKAYKNNYVNDTPKNNYLINTPDNYTRIPKRKIFPAKNSPIYSRQQSNTNRRW